jgi:hypothetical protein
MNSRRLMRRSLPHRPPRVLGIAHTRRVSVAGLCQPQAKLSRKSNQIARRRIRRSNPTCPASQSSLCALTGKCRFQNGRPYRGILRRPLGMCRVRPPLSFARRSPAACPLSQKPVRKRFLPQKGGGLSVEGVFAKKISGAGEDSALGLSRGSYATVHTPSSSGALQMPW